MPAKPAVAGRLQPQPHVSGLPERPVTARAEGFNDTLNLTRDAPYGERPLTWRRTAAEDARHRRVNVGEIARDLSGGSVTTTPTNPSPPAP